VTSESDEPAGDALLLNTVRFYLEGALLTPVSIFGLLGNKLNFF
jgi:hypothetical protein